MRYVSTALWSANFWSAFYLMTVHMSTFYIGTCEASRFDSNSNRPPIRFDSKVMGRFENFLIESAVPAHCSS